MSINVNIDDDEIVKICLGGLAPRLNVILSAFLAREKSPSFFDLQSMLLVEENHVLTRSTTCEGQMLYTNSEKKRKRPWEKEPSKLGRAQSKATPRTKLLQPTRCHKRVRWNIRKKGEKPCRTEPTKQLRPVQILWQVWPLRGTILQKEE